jgi:hypothetical protein
MKRFAIVKNGYVENIATAESFEILSALLPGVELIEETDESGFAWLGAEVIEGRIKAPQMYSSWAYDSEKNVWLPPVPQPEKPCFWDEASLSWIELTLSQPEVTDGDA